MKKHSQSIFDTLLNILPGNPGKYIIKTKDYIEPSIAKSLFSIWRTGESDSINRIYKRPISLAHDDIKKMKESGLIRTVGKNIEITDKGAEVIKIMVLGDDRSTFENNDIIIDYNEALSNTKGIKTANKKMTK